MTIRQLFDSAQRKPRYSKKEFAQRGDEIYESQVCQQIDEEIDRGRIVAIDIETGEFELADDTMMATRQLYDRLPDAQPWVVRIGYRAMRRFGARIGSPGFMGENVAKAEFCPSTQLQLLANFYC